MSKNTETDQVEQEIQSALACVNAKELQCTCGRTVVSSGNLYFCNECEDTIYCKFCGPFMHHKKIGHSFDIDHGVMVINTLQPDENEEKKSRLGLIHQLGLERYTKITDKCGNVLKLSGSFATSLIVFISEMAQVLSNLSVQTMVQSSHLAMASGLVYVGVFGLEIAYYSYQLIRHKISGPQYCKLVSNSAIRTGTIFVAVKVGMTAGACIGTMICPGIGTSIGIGIGFIAGLVSGYYLSKAAEKGWDFVWEKCIWPEAKKNKQMVAEALAYFDYLPKDVGDEKVFNRQSLDKRFRSRAKDCHPDRRDDKNPTLFHMLSGHYGVLAGVLEKRNDNENKEIIKKMASVQFTIENQLDNDEP